MSISYDKRRLPSAKDASERSNGISSPKGLPPSVSNSAMASAMGYRDMGGDAPGLRSAMEAKAMSIIRPGSFGADYEEPRAEAEASRIGNRFSGASGVEELKSRMGDALGADFSSVRFHTGAEAASMAASAGALAFTSGRDIYLGGGGFDAAVAAHEMVHTVQQGAVQAAAPVTSAPAGAVQYLRNPFAAGWEKIQRSHEKALDSYNEHQTEYRQMSRLDRAKWALQNPIAHARGKWGDTQAETAARKAKREEEDERAKKLSKLWKKGRKEDGEWDEGVLHDAAPVPVQAPPPNSPPQQEDETQGNIEHIIDQTGKATGDLGADLGLSLPGLPLDITGLVDAGKKMKGGDKAGLSEGGMTATGALGGVFGTLGDAAGLYGNISDTIEAWKKGDKRGAVANGFRAGADALSVVGDIAGFVPDMDPLTAGISGAANTVRAATDFGSAIQEGRSQRRMRKRGEANQQSIESLEQHMGNLSDTDREKAEKELARRKSNAKTIRQAGRAAGVRRDENIVSGSANTARAVGAWTSMGLAISGNPAAAVASAVGTGAGALAQFIGNRFTKHAKRKLRRDTVNEELGLDEKIAALKNGDSAYMEALGITPDQAKQMSDRDAKHLILKSMGFKSGKRKEAFNQITKNRAKALTDRANADDQSDEAGIIQDMFLSKTSSGEYDTDAVAEKLGLEEMEDENPFAARAAGHTARKQARSELWKKITRKKNPPAANPPANP